MPGWFPSDWCWSRVGSTGLCELRQGNILGLKWPSERLSWLAPAEGLDAEEPGNPASGVAGGTHDRNVPR